MKHTMSHDLPLDLAKKAADKALEVYAQRFPDYEPKVAWISDRTAEVSFKAMGSVLKAVVALSEKDIAVDMDVPLLFRPFKTKAMSIVEEKIREWLDKAKAGALD